MANKRTNPVWYIPVKELKASVKRNATLTAILKEFGLNGRSRSSFVLQQRMTEEGIDFSHIPLGTDSNTGLRRGTVKAIPLEQVLVKNSSYHRGNLKKRLIRENLLKNECHMCKLPPIWNGKELILVIDHINGVNNDHRLENLRLLCPNCNSQTSTFSGRNNKK